MHVCMHPCVCVCVRACLMYDTDQCHIHFNSLWFVCVYVCVCVCVWGGGGVSFCMMLCVGCFGGTVLYVCTEYHI